MEQIRRCNPDKEIIIILDNFRSHHAKLTIEKAEELHEILVFLPPYSPDLNPIEFIWKSIKRAISSIFIESKEHFKSLIRNSFNNFSKSVSFAKNWISTFLGEFKSIIY